MRPLAEVCTDPGVVAAHARVSIVLVTYYGASNLERLWESLCALDYPRDRVSLLVVDNDPERRAFRWFAEHAPHVRVIVPGRNTGYAGGNALGMEEALASGVDYVAIVTQDTEVKPGWLRELVAVAERHPRAGAVQPKILRRDADGRIVIHSWGNELHFLGVGYVGGDGLPDRPLEVRPIGYASGAGVLFRASALRQVGVFDPELFMYHEDSDLCWRLRLAGWDVLLAPSAVMYHDWRFAPSSDKFYLIERNRLINLLTHYRARTLALIMPALLLLEVAALVYAQRTGWLGRRASVYRHFFRPSTWAHIRKKRRTVQSLRTESDRAVTAHLTDMIDFPLPASSALHRLLDAVLAAYWRVARRLIRW